MGIDRQRGGIPPRGIEGSLDYGGLMQFLWMAEFSEQKT
jgi:hypothetical protein